MYLSVGVCHVALEVTQCTPLTMERWQQADGRTCRLTVEDKEEANVLFSRVRNMHYRIMEQCVFVVIVGLAEYQCSVVTISRDSQSQRQLATVN